MYTQKLNTTTDSKLLAAYIADNADFENACRSGDPLKIMSIVNNEMEKNDLYTKGALKLKADIFKRIQYKDKISDYEGSVILSFVWNSRLAGNGLAVLTI